MIKRIGVLAFFLAFLLPFSAPAATHKIALIVGNNEGSDTKPFLRYAEQDAKNLYNALIQIGGFAPSETKLLLGKNPQTVLETLHSLQAQAAHLLKNPQDQILFLFYFSGHSEGNLLEMGPSQLDFAELHASLRKIPFTARLLILDTCHSGEIIQTKGGIPIPSFSIPADEPALPKGEVIVTSSTAYEDSLESSEFQGSFFTHYFISGLRGAADFNLDGKVSLNEAFSYANQNTILKAKELRRSQTPTYDLDLTGSGEIYLSEIMNGAPLLFLSPPEDGVFLIYDAVNRALVAEIIKSPGSPRYVALTKGKLLVRKKTADYYLEQELTTLPGGLYYFRDEDGQRVKISPARRILSFESTQKDGHRAVTLREGEIVRLKLAETISTKSSHTGDKIRLEAAEDLFVNGHLVVSAGAPATGEILAAREKRGIVHGELICRLGYVQAIDGQWIPLNSIVSRGPSGLKTIPEGSSGNESLSPAGSETETDAASAVTALFFLPFYPLFKGKDAVLQEGALFDAYVSRSTVIEY